MATLRFLPIFLALFASYALADAPSGETWFTIASPNFRVHHTLPLEPYARSLTQAFERSLPEIEKRMNWKLPHPIDVVVMDPSDSANGLAMNFPNTHIELFSSPFPADSPLTYYINWADELAMHELTHIVANDTTLGGYKTLRAIFGSWVKPNGLQPVWISEGLAVFEETSLSKGGRGRSPFLDALLRESVIEGKLNDPTYTSLDRFNDTVPWWPSGNTQYLLGYTIQAIPTKITPNLPGKLSFENGGTMIFAPNRSMQAVSGQDWAQIWDGATKTLQSRYANNPLAPLACKLTTSGRHTGGHALSSDGWIYFSGEDWHRGYHLSRVRADGACDPDSVERLVRKPYSGPSQVAVSPNGSKIAFAKTDPGYESEYSDIYIYNAKGGTDRITRDKRVRDPAFVGEDVLLYVRANADTSQTIVSYDLPHKTENELYTCRPMERIAGLFARDGRIVFSLHNNKGHEKIHELKDGKATALLARVDSVREFERNPHIASDGSIYFAAAYGYGPQEIYRVAPHAQKATRVLSSRSGYLDRPVVLADGKTIVAEEYGLNGINLARAEIQKNAPGLPVPKEDLHEFLTGEKPQTLSAPEIELPPSEPYSIGNTGTSMWPQYWFPEVAATENGFLAGASTSGNDALGYHRYFGIAQYDSRANFPVYRAFYRNRVYPVNFHFEANQTNNYFLSTEVSNRAATYSVETIFPLRDFSVAFGTSYRERKLFGSAANHFLLFQNIAIDRTSKTPSAISTNWGAAFSNFVAAYPSSRYETSFVDWRPELALFFRGLHPSHSISLSGAAGITSNRLLASNYYQGGGPSPLDPSNYIVRGYPSDTLFGQRIATVNLAYTLPIAHPYRGLGTNPIFLQSIGLRFLGDAGTANYMSVYSADNKFLFYERGEFGRRKIYGAGAELIAKGSIFYHIPVTTIAGYHHGFEKRYGGDHVFYFSIGLGIERGTGAARNPHLLD